MERKARGSKATDPADIQTSIEKLRSLRFEAKGQLQRHCGDLDPDDCPVSGPVFFLLPWRKM